MYNRKLYAGGKFDTAGGIASSHIAAWDTATHTWDSLIGILNGNVYALCVYNNNLFVGGDFTIADDTIVNRIAMWNGTTWNSVGKGFDTGAVYALTVSNDTLYAGGSFLKSNGVIVNHIAKLAGSAWKPLDSGTNNTVYALTDIPFLGGLFVGGAFTKAGGNTANYIGLFDDYYSWQWSSILEPAMNDTVKALGNLLLPPVSIIEKRKQINWSTFGNILIVGGVFDSVGGKPTKYITAWGDNPGGWDSTEVLNGPVFALSNNLLANYNLDYLGGKFNMGTNDFPPASTITINNVAKFSFYCLNCDGSIPTTTNKSSVDVYPNPSNGLFNLTIRNYELGMIKIEVYNVLGEKVFSQLSTFNYPFSIDLSAQPSGVYLYRVFSQNAELIGEGKFIIQK